MKHPHAFIFTLLFYSFFSFAQQPTTPSETIEKALQQKEEMTKNSLVKNISFENIGPTVMSGRVTDLAVNPENPTEFYVAYASGGLWHTVNNGTSFTPILDTSNTQNVGDIAVDWKTNTIWVGTGENNASRSSYAGIGILKSTDNGKTWQNVGLRDSHHIGRILINPNNSDEVTVGVTGHLYSPNKERGIYKTTDGGTTWKKTHQGYLDDLYYSYGYYFGHIYVAPDNVDHIYVYGVPIVKSKDGGKTFTSIDADNVHGDHHALWINPKNTNHLINGNDGGVNITYDDGENWIKNNSPSVGQFYSVNVDNEKPYNVYGGLQDNGVWVGANNASENVRWHASGQYPWESIMGGDGMQVQIDSRNANIVYTGFQFGNYFRINREKDETTYIQPKHELGENPYRFNWQTPILLSPHNQDILYLGGNKLMRSMNQGTDFTAISGDLTNGGKKGNVAYGTLSTISESPFQFGLIYTGSDDGLVYVTKDAGGNWTNSSSSLPKDLWVSRVVASQHKKERVYLALNGYRWDDFTPYVYMSDDYGQTWKNISSNIPASPVNVIREDPKNENLLFLGTDNGAYVSFNQGNSWETFSKGLPNVAVHDIVIQNEASDLLLGTHGRSIYKTNISGLQTMTSEKMNNAITLFDVESVRHSDRWGSSFGTWSKPFEPSTTIQFYANVSGQQTIKILSEKNSELQTVSINADKGFNNIDYDLTISESGKKALLKENTSSDIKKAENGKFYLPKGIYTIIIGNEKTNLEIK